MTDINDRLLAAVEEVNRAAHTNGKSLPPVKQLEYDFERLGEQIAASLLQAAEEQLVQAQNMLEQTRAFSEDVRARIKAKAHELADMNTRLKAFGGSILEAHRKFHGEPDDNTKQ